MQFKNKIEVWKPTGVEPDDARKESGFDGGFYPPAGIFNWLFHNNTAAISELQTFFGDAFDTNGILKIEKGGTGAGDKTTAFERLSFRDSIKDDNILNCNTLTSSGMYRVYITNETTASDNNYPARYGLVITYSVTGYITQVFFDVASFKQYLRYSSNGANTWSTWKQTYDTSNKPSLTDLEGILTIPNGGTGATTTSKARENLSVNMLTFISLKQLGITAGSETIETIVNSMPIYSELVYEVGATNAKIYPNSYGVLRALKINETRTHFFFYLKGNNVHYFGNYDSSLSNPWQGWTTIYGSSNLPVPAYNHDTKELTNEDVDTIKIAGHYLAAGNNSCTNTPFPSGTSFGLEVMRTAGIHYVQILYSANLGSYMRFYDGSKWDAWCKQANIDDIPTVIFGKYTGDGTEERFIDLGFTPTAIEVYTSSGQQYAIISTNPVAYGGLALNGFACATEGRKILEVVNNGFKVFFKDVSGTTDDIISNLSDITYYFKAYKGGSIVEVS